MKIKILFMDVDGTLTDGRLYIGAQGEVMKAFDAKDGYGIVEFKKQGGIPVILTGRQSEIVKARAAEIGITELHQGVTDKLACLQMILERYGLAPGEAACIGDDLNDLPCMEYCGVSGCPADAAAPVRDAADYVCSAAGGRGAVREFLDWLQTTGSDCI